MQVRLADNVDLEAITELSQIFHDEFKQHGALLPYSKRKVILAIAKSIHKSLALVAENDGGIIGFMLLDDYEPFYSDEKALWDFGFYVLPKIRGSRAAILLRDAAVAIAEDLGMPLFMGISVGGDLERRDKFFIRSGFRRIGALYIKE